MQQPLGHGKLTFAQLIALPVALAVITMCLQLGDPIAMHALRYERAAILEGEVWRLLTGHLVHLGWSHLLLNLAGLGLVWALVGERFAIGSWIAILLWCALASSAAMLLLEPHLDWYAGLSGVLHGLLFAGATAALKAGSREGLWLVLVVGGKLAWEQIAGPLPGSAEVAGGAVIVDAHLFGALAGLAAGNVLRTRVRRLPDAP